MSTRSAIKSMMYQNALNSLYNGAVMPHEREILARAPLPTDIVDPFVSQDVDPRQIMGFAYNSLVTWIDEAKKANYFSKKFTDLSKLVMKGVMTMGRGLVALHNRGEDLAQAPMQIGDLISVSSYHFRKSYLGVIQTAQSHPEISERLLINQLSWTNMLFRLYKTKDKLEKAVSSQRSVVRLNAEALGNSRPNCAGDQGNQMISDPFSDDDQGKPMISAVSGRSLPDIAAIFEPGAFSAPRAFSALDGSSQCGIRNAKLDYENSEARKAKTEKIASVMDSKNIIRNSKSISSEISSLEEAHEVCCDPQTGHEDVCSLTRERVSCVRPHDNTTSSGELQPEISATDTTAPAEESQPEISHPDNPTPAGESQAEIRFTDTTAPAGESQPEISATDTTASAGESQAEISTTDKTNPESELPDEDRSPEITPTIRDDNPPTLAVRNPLREVQASPDSDEERDLRPRAHGDVVPGQERPPENPGQEPMPDQSMKEQIHAADQSPEISDPAPIPDSRPEEQIHAEDPPPDDPPDRMTADPNIPFYLEILRHAFDRSSPNEEGAITFTEEEIIYLACDPEFAEFYPDQAAQMRKILAQIQGDG